MNVTKEQVVSVLQMIMALGDAIRQLGSVPAGHLYVRVQDKLSIHDFQLMLTRLEDAGLITYSPSHLITWVGPKNGKKSH